MKIEWEENWTNEKSDCFELQFEYAFDTNGLLK